MTKVLFLSPGFELGGGERSLLDLIASFRAAKADLHPVLITSRDGSLKDEAQAMGVESCVVQFPSSLARLGDAGAGGPAGDQRSLANLIAAMSTAVPAVASYVVRLKGEIKRLAPDLIHTNGLKMHVLGAWAATASTPVVWHVRDYVGRRPIMSHLMRMHSRRCAAAIAISRSVAADLMSCCGQGFPVFTVYNAIDTTRFTPEGPRLDLDALAGLPPAPVNTLRVGLLATMARWKGHEVFLRALSQVAEAHPLRGYIIGGPLYQTEASEYEVDELRLMARDMGLADRVGFTGFVRDPAAAIRALDVVVHASTEPEPFGRTIAEAMACGRPVIVSEAGGAQELISNGVDALAYKPGSVSALARCIGKLVESEALRSKLAHAAQLKASKLFNRSRLALEIAPIYSLVLGDGVSLAS